jgi:hypothetical protein
MEGVNENGAAAGTVTPQEKGLNNAILLNTEHAVNGKHRPEIRRCRLPNPNNASGYGYQYKWCCDCGARSRRTWRYGEIRWPSRFFFSMVTPPRWQSGRMEHTSASESACDHVRNVTRGPNRGKKRCAFYCGGLASQAIDGVPACARCAEELRS